MPRENGKFPDKVQTMSTSLKDIWVKMCIYISRRENTKEHKRTCEGKSVCPGR